MQFYFKIHIKYVFMLLSSANSGDRNVWFPDKSFQKNNSNNKKTQSVFVDYWLDWLFPLHLSSNHSRLINRVLLLCILTMQSKSFLNIYILVTFVLSIFFFSENVQLYNL